MSIELATKLLAIGKPKIGIIGDSCYDVDVHGHIERFAAEASTCPVFVEERSESRPGMAGAVEMMAIKLGAQARKQSGMDCGEKIRFFVDDKQVFRVDDTPKKPLVVDKQEAANITAWADCLLISDYGKGTVTEEILRIAIDGAKAKGIPCIVDPHTNTDWLRYAGATAIKCNMNEFLASECRHQIPIIVMTDSRHGIRLWNKLSKPEQQSIIFPSRQRNAIDPTGAGDCVLACLGVCVAAGMAWPEACEIANAAAGLKVERRGAVGVSRVDVVADLCHGEKILPLPLLSACLQSHREHYQKIVFTNGCFDLLGPHHCHLLREAKKHGDILVVAVDTDASVRALKGQGRPIVPLEDRMAILTSLESVDYVIPFGCNDELLAIVDRIKPSVLAKGADYEGKEIIGCNTVTTNGGKIVLIPLLPGRSTTATIKHIEQVTTVLAYQNPDPTNRPWR